jgi:hypothetical protein
MVSTDSAGDETCPEREHAAMPNAFTQPSPLARCDTSSRRRVTPTVAKLSGLALASVPGRVSPAMR